MILQFVLLLPDLRFVLLLLVRYDRSVALQQDTFLKLCALSLS